MTTPTLRYDNGQDWVEVAPGISKLTMRQLAALDSDLLSVAHTVAVERTVDAHFIDNAAEVVDWRNDVLGLTVQQWNWWKSRLWQAARDEKIAPEA
jgi:hypothetical protein